MEKLTSNKRSKKHTVKAAIAAAAITATAVFGVNQFGNRAGIPKVEPITKSIKSELWPLFYVKNSYRKSDDEFYTVQNTSSGPILLVTRGGEIKTYILDSKPVGTQPIITADNKNVYVVFDNDDRLFIIDTVSGIVNNTHLSIKLKNPALGTHNRWLYLLTESSNKLYMISPSGYVDKLDITKILEEEGTDSVKNPFFANSSMGAFFICTGFKNAHSIVWNGSMKNSKYFYMDLSDLFSYIGNPDNPRIAFMNDELCLLSKMNGHIGCMNINEGNITKIIQQDR